ncbi:hypothetical protein EBS02_12830 [bacterium]|nr:hypothetical protein [bacterium]
MGSHVHKYCRDNIIPHIQPSNTVNKAPTAAMIPPNNDPKIIAGVSEIPSNLVIKKHHNLLIFIKKGALLPHSF